MILITQKANAASKPTTIPIIIPEFELLILFPFVVSSKEVFSGIEVIVLWSTSGLVILFEVSEFEQDVVEYLD